MTPSGHRKSVNVAVRIIVTDIHATLRASINSSGTQLKRLNLYRTYPQGAQILPILLPPPIILASLGHHVTVADGGHGDEGPPQAQGNGRKVVVGIGLKCTRIHHC